MWIVEDIESCRKAVRKAQAEGKRVGLVPTMGALHEGHLSLIAAARRSTDVTAVTIFVNPTQFGPNEDLARYPRPFDRDAEACSAHGVDILFAPTVETMYPSVGGRFPSRTSIHVASLTDSLCGPLRPGHFDGVATVVAKLFNILPADIAYFGEKDYQQLMVIRRMVRDLDIPIEIFGCPTVREADGLAMSSRNAYLSAAARRQAASLSRALFQAVERTRFGERRAAVITGAIRDEILAAGPCQIDYIDVVDPGSLEKLDAIDVPARICLAVRIDGCRLIDNVAVDAAPDP